MNNDVQPYMHISDEFRPEERMRRKERRLLVVCLFLSYLACLATLWYIWNAPRQAFDTFWLSFAQSRFTLLLLPLLILCACYVTLVHVTGNITGWRVKHLDERQRMVRDQAHRYAYRIIALLCLFAPLYLILQNMLTSPLKASVPYMVTLHLSKSVPRPVKLNLAQAMPLIQVQKSNQLLLWSVHPVSSAQPQSIFIARTAIFNQGIYYCLFLLVLALIIWTLPRAIIAWKERA